MQHVLIPKEFLIDVGEPKYPRVIKASIAFFKALIKVVLRPSGIENIYSLYSKEAAQYDLKHHLTTAFNDTRLRKEAAIYVSDFLVRDKIFNRRPIVLDIATGTGLTLQMVDKYTKARNIDADMYGIDFTQEMLDRANAQPFTSGNIHFKRSDATDLVSKKSDNDGLFRFDLNSVECITNIFGIGGIMNSSKSFIDQLLVLREGGIAIMVDIHKPYLDKKHTKLPLGLPPSPVFVSRSWEDITKPIVLKQLWGWKDPTQDFYTMPLASYYDDKNGKYFGFDVLERNVSNMRWWFGLPVMSVCRLIVKKVSITEEIYRQNQKLYSSSRIL